MAPSQLLIIADKFDHASYTHATKEQRRKGAKMQILATVHNYLMLFPISKGKKGSHSGHIFIPPPA